MQIELNYRIFILIKIIVCYFLEQIGLSYLIYMHKCKISIMTQYKKVFVVYHISRQLLDLNIKYYHIYISSLTLN